MLILKANPELKAIFSRLINTIGVTIKWNEVFIITNNSMILAGELRSLIFDYEDKRAYSDIVEFSLEGKEIVQISENALIANLLNMALYAFSKWGSIKGVKVEKDYAQLNNLFLNILKEIQVEPSFTERNFRFFHKGLQITYEDVIDIALVQLREEKPENEEEHELGLWHKVCWKLETYVFQKQLKNEADVVKSRIGKNFYMVDFICPSCKEKIYMTVYPEGKDVLIETEEARVYLAKAYACNTCNCFYTPKPGKLLQEGEVYYLQFEDDRTAYEDYLEHLGKPGDRIPSLRLNEYEADRNAKERTKDNADEDFNTEDTNTDTDKEEDDERKERYIAPIQNKEKDDIINYKNETINVARNKNTSEEKYSQNSKKDIKTIEVKETTSKTKDDISQKMPKESIEAGIPFQRGYDLKGKTIEELKAIALRIEQEDAGISVPMGSRRSTNENHTPEYLAAVKTQLNERLKAKYDARMKMIERMTDRQLVDLKKQIQKEQEIAETDIQAYVKQIDEILYKNEEESIYKKIETAKSKSYNEINRMINEIEQGEGLDGIRKEAIEKLKKIKTERGKQEAEQLVKGMPLHMDRKQYEAYYQKIKQYEDVDLSPYEQQLERNRDIVEKDEIALLVKRVDKKDREELYSLYEQLKIQDFNEQNLKPYLEKIHDKIYELDKAEIDMICPDMMRISFNEGLTAYKKIEEGTFLPELKENTLKMIKKRLTKLKTDENVQLVKKLKKEIIKKIRDFSCLHFYEARRLDRQQDVGQEDSENAVINHALRKYAARRSEFEFPILICDSSMKGNGKKGFVLTSDHIFYRDFIESGVINIIDIEKLEYEKGKIKKGIYIKRFSGEVKKLPNAVKQEEKEVFAEVLDDFIDYLKEKPESRNIDYLLKEEHTIKCCYRCGHSYKGGNICPKCGSKAND